MPASPACPEADFWKSLFGDTMPPSQRERYERHLESCALCQEQAHRVLGTSDELVRLAREVGDPARRAGDSTLEAARKRLYEEARPSVPDLFFLRPGREPGSLGALGCYEVREVIGQGGMGVVLKAFDPSLGRVVAIKVLSPWLACSDDARQRFIREARAAARVSHENVVQVHAVDEQDGLPYLVMRLVEGESLQGRLDREGPLPVDEVIRLGMQTAAGLAAAHEQGLVHRDIKPANLLLERGRVLVTDFGLARGVEDVGLTREGVVAGTPEYMAPEQARGEKVDFRADLFSLGCVMYALCTGEAPFQGDTMFAVLRKVNAEEPPPVRQRNPAVPPWLAEFLARLMAKAPAHRIASAAEAASLLRGYLDRKEEPPPLPPLPRRGAPRSALIGLPLVASALLLAFLLAGGDKGKENAAGPVTVEFNLGEGLKNPQLRPLGAKAAALMKADGQGLRFTIPAARENAENIGVEAALRLRGDFELTLAYEILKLQTPPPPRGVGVLLMVRFDSRTAGGATVTRTRTPGGELFGANFIDLSKTGEELPLKGLVNVPAKGPTGRLRLKRTGATLTFLAANGDGELEPIQTYPAGAEDVSAVRALCTTGRTEAALDARLIRLEAKADQVLGQASVPAPLAEPTPAPQPSSGKVIPIALAVGLALTLLLAVSLGLWLRAKLPRKEEQTMLVESEAIVSFRCHGCGATIKAPSKLGGRKATCPGCKQTLQVPSIQTAPTAPDVPTTPSDPSDQKRPWLAYLLAGLLLLPLVLFGVWRLVAVPNAPKPVAVEPVRLFKGHKGPVHDVRFTPDGRQLVSAGGWPHGDHTVRVWDVATGQQTGRIDMPADAHAFELSPDGKFALVGMHNGDVLSMDLQALQVVKTLKSHTKATDWVAFGPLPDQAFSSSADGQVRVWHLGEARVVTSFRMAGKTGRGGAVFPDGKRILTGNSDGLLQIWDVATGNEIRRVPLKEQSYINSMSLTDGGATALVAGGAGLRAIDVETGRVIRQFQSEGENVHHAARSPDGALLLAAAFDGVIRLWNYRTGELLREMTRHEGFGFSVAFSPDGRLGASGGGGYCRNGGCETGTDHDIRVYELAGGPLAAAPAPPGRPEGAGPVADVTRRPTTHLAIDFSKGIDKQGSSALFGEVFSAHRVVVERLAVRCNTMYTPIAMGVRLIQLDVKAARIDDPNPPGGTR